MPTMAMPQPLTLTSSAAASEDRTLVAAVAAGDQRALETLYQRHGSACFGYLLRRLEGDRPAAEDLLQDLMLAAWRGAAAFRGDSEVRTWLLGIAHHLWLQELRRRSRRPTPSEDGEALLTRLQQPDPRPDAAAVAGLRQALDALPEDLRVAVDLTFGQGLRLQDAARILDLPLGTVKSRLFRARQQLRHLLEASR
jgi:RNA polymerase sigma factor (sigma-70 family)